MMSSCVKGWGMVFSKFAHVSQIRKGQQVQWHEINTTFQTSKERPTFCTRDNNSTDLCREKSLIYSKTTPVTNYGHYRRKPSYMTHCTSATPTTRESAFFFFTYIIRPKIMILTLLLSFSHFVLKRSQFFIMINSVMYYSTAQRAMSGDSWQFICEDRRNP